MTNRMTTSRGGCAGHAGTPRRRRSRSCRSRRRSAGRPRAMESCSTLSLTIVRPDVERDRDRAHPDRRHRRAQVLRVDPGEGAAGSPCRRPSTGVVRAVGRIVVCVDADAEVSTEMISSASKIRPPRSSPNTAGPMALKTSSALASLPRPMPVVPTPAKATRRDGDDGVGDQQQEGGEDGRAAGGAGRVVALLVDRDRGVPAPVDEDRQQQRLGQRRPVAGRTGHSHDSDGCRDPSRRVAGVDLHERVRPRRRRARPARR